MNKLDELNKRLLVVIGLSSETAQIIMDRIEEAETENTRLRTALTDAVWAADYLSEQQAMPDDGYKARLESARAVLANAEISNERHE